MLSEQALCNQRCCLRSSAYGNPYVTRISLCGAQTFQALTSSKIHVKMYNGGYYVLVTYTPQKFAQHTVHLLNT